MSQLTPNPAGTVSMSLRAIFSAAQAWIDRHYPGLSLDAVCLKLDDGNKISLPTPPRRTRPQPSQPVRPHRGAHARLVAAATSNPIPGKALIRKAGLRYNSANRQALSDLARSGKLTRTPDGYRLTPVT
jgi:hypothetical protein